VGSAEGQPSGSRSSIDHAQPHPANDGQFAALVLQGFSGRLVSPREAAALLGVNRETIYRLCKRGELPHIRVAAALRIDLTRYASAEKRLVKEP
jgi:excisionase family DNA binding protein